MANIRIDLNRAPNDGETISFKAPCDAKDITGLIIYYPNDNGVTVSQEYTLNDASGSDIGELDNIFAEGAIVKVILDTDVNNAYVQNPDTNAYLEGRFGNKAKKVHEHTASEVKFSDGATLQEKYNNGVLGGLGGIDGKDGYSIFYADIEFYHEEPEPGAFGGTFNSVNALRLSNQGLGVKTGDLLISKTGAMGIVTSVDYPSVSFSTLANISAGVESPAITDISVTEAVNGMVTMVNTLNNGETETIVISADADGNPAGLTYNGTAIPLTFTKETEVT